MNELLDTLERGNMIVFRTIEEYDECLSVLHSEGYAWLGGDPLIPTNIALRDAMAEYINAQVSGYIRRWYCSNKIVLGCFDVSDKSTLRFRYYSDIQPVTGGFKY